MKKPNYANTWAIRVSLALIAAGKSLNIDSHRVLKATHKRQWVQVNMKGLAEQLPLFDGSMPDPSCLSACYSSDETWFWPLS